MTWETLFIVRLMRLPFIKYRLAASPHLTNRLLIWTYFLPPNSAAIELVYKKFIQVYMLAEELNSSCGSPLTLQEFWITQPISSTLDQSNTLYNQNNLFSLVMLTCSLAFFFSPIKCSHAHTWTEVPEQAIPLFSPSKGKYLSLIHVYAIRAKTTSTVGAGMLQWNYDVGSRF